MLRIRVLCPDPEQTSRATVEWFMNVATSEDPTYEQLVGDIRDAYEHLENEGVQFSQKVLIGIPISGEFVWLPDERTEALLRILSGEDNES